MKFFLSTTSKLSLTSKLVLQLIEFREFVFAILIQYGKLVEFIFTIHVRKLKFAEIMPIFVVRCAIWYHLYNFKNVKNTHEEVLILVKSQAEACNFTKINTPWVFFTFFKLYKWYQIAQRITFDDRLCEWTRCVL